MIAIVSLLRLAGAVQLALISANLFAPKKLRYAENMAGATVVIRNIFYVHAFFIVFMLAAFGAISIALAAPLASGEPVARAVCAFLAAFWSLRVLIQLFYYDAETRRQNRGYDVLFLLAFSFLAGAYGAAAIGS